jgi:hypothetical protein
LVFSLPLDSLQLNDIIPDLMTHKRFAPLPALVIGFIWFLLYSNAVFPAPVSSDTAEKAFKGWLRADALPMGTALSMSIKRTQAVIDSSGNTAYYVIHLDPAGYVIISADDLVEPVIAFSPRGRFNPLGNDTVAVLVNRDMARRMARIGRRIADAPALKAHAKWLGVLSGSPGGGPSDAETSGDIVTVSQVRVAPFLRTLWSQQTDETLSLACYDYFTPPGAAGNPNNYPCGCIATALAQVMFYFQYPTTGVGAGSFPITINGSASTGTLRGGDGSGGPYQWGNMPLVPNGVTSTEAQAIGALCYDAGVSVNMDYESGGSSAVDYKFQNALTNTFNFSNAGYDEDASNGLAGTNLVAMINPSLDARLPVMLAIEPAGGHALLADGYGYSAGTLFHHLNPGWGGNDEIWYALPAIDTDNGDFTMIVGCTYNIYTNGGGEIISGQVTDPAGAPIAGASVAASRNGGGIYAATTDSNGVYALSRLPPASRYTLTATNAGDASATGVYATGVSTYNVSSGNVWGANFVLSPPLLAIPEAGFSAIGPVGGPFSAGSQVYILTNTSAASINWILANTNSWLSATSANGTLAAGGNSSLTISLSSTATNLPAGTMSGMIWITNLGNHLAQAFSFSLTIETSDYPIGVSGFNQDIVVENTSVGGNALLYAQAFDPNNAFFGPLCFYEAGVIATNFAGGMAVAGLPVSGGFTSESDNATTFQFGPYTSNNVLYLNPAANTGTLTLNSPGAYKTLSVLAASAIGGGNGSLVVHFADNTVSSPISFQAPEYFITNSAGPGAALTNFGLLVAGSFVELYADDYDSDGYFPALFQTSVNLLSPGLNTKAITSVTFTMPSGPAATGIFALSGTQSSLPSNPPVSFVTDGNAPRYSGGTLTLQLTNLAGQGQVVIAASTDLLQWAPVFTNPSGFGTFTYTDSVAGTFPRRFYRAVTP